MFEELAHANCVLLTAFVQRAVAVTELGVFPAGFGMTHNEQGFHLVPPFALTKTNCLYYKPIQHIWRLFLFRLLMN